MNLVTMHFVPEPFLKIVNERLASRDLLHDTVTGGEVRRWHQQAWESRFNSAPNRSQEFPFQQDQNASASALDFALLQTIDRVFVSPQPVREIVPYLEHLDRLASARIARFPANAIILYARMPHYPWEIVFAKRAELCGHRVIVIQNVFVNNRIVLEEGTDFSRPIFLKSASDSTLPAIVQSDLSSEFLESSKTLNLNEPLRTRVAWWIALLLWLAFPRTQMPRIRRVALSRKNQIIFKRSELIWTLIRMLRSQRAARRFLNRHEISTPTTSPFALVALHYQPEATTDPAGGRYSDQVGFVQDLRAALNKSGHENLPILVREHPRQLARATPALGEANFRSVEFYEALLRIDGVEIVSRSRPTAELFEVASVIATVNGTAAWEGLFAGRPAIVGRRVWFGDCRAVATLEDLHARPALMGELLDLSAQDVENSLFDFLRAEGVTLLGTNDARDLNVDRGDWGAFADSMIDGMIERLTSTASPGDGHR